MELRELGYFLAIYEERSVSAAARRSYVSQPSVSEALANLEHELATRLFVRHRKGATPTAAGDQLYPIAQRLVAEARGLAALFQPAPRRRLTLGLMRSLDLARVQTIVARLTRDGDDGHDGHDDGHELRLVDADQPCDLRIVSRTLCTADEVFVPLWQERYVVALPRAHPLAAHPTLRGSDLAGAKLIARCHCEHAARFAGPGQRFDVVAIAPTEEWALALVAAGVGLAIIPEGVASPDDAIALRPLRDVQARREVGVAYGAHGAPAELQRALSRLVTAAPLLDRSARSKPRTRPARTPRRRTTAHGRRRA
jgi:DNA-binding transcriptional LysR family regulator